MQFNNFFFATVVAAVSASSAYAALVPRANPTCGTTEDATLSDCRNLVNSKWTDSMLNYDRTCTWGLIFRAYNPICSPGNCCVYVTNENYFTSVVQDAAKAIVNGCASSGTNSVNGVIEIGDGDRVCIGSGNACGDCFDD